MATIAGLAACGLAGSPAGAATGNSSIAVSATVQATCSISAAALAFGTYASTQLDASSSLSVSCTTTTPYVLSLDAGTGSGASVTTRKMTNGTQTLSYSIYSDSTRASVWGTTVATNTVAGVGSGASQSFSVYGRIPGSQYPTPGNYTDTVTATIAY